MRFPSSRQSIFVFFSLFFAVELASYTQARAQTAPVSPPVLPAPAQPPAPPELETMMQPFRLAHYDQFVKVATLALDKMDKPDPHILYWRATAEERMGQLEAAEKDFALLGDFTGWPKYPPASEAAATLKTMLELRPEHERDIVVNGQVAFKAYFTDEDDFTQSVLNALPAAHLAAAKLLRNKLDEVPIYIFSANQYDRFVKFYTLLDEPPHSWWRILSSRYSITVSQSDVDGHLQSTQSLDRSFAHELTHVNFQRTIGNVPDFPNWFNEGAAQLVESSLAPSMLTTNDRKIQTLLQQNAILPLELVASHSQFHEAVDASQAGEQKGDPYAQGLNMTRYLGLVLNRAKLSDFIQQVTEKRSFAMAVKDATGMTMQEFYDSWLKFIAEDN